MLIFFICLSSYGVYTGYSVFRKRLNPSRGYLHLLILLVIGVSVDFIFNW